MLQPIPERIQALLQLHRHFSHFTVDVSDHEAVLFFQESGNSQIPHFYSMMQKFAEALATLAETIQGGVRQDEPEQSEAKYRVQIIKEGADPALDLTFYRPTLADGQRWHRIDLIKKISVVTCVSNVNCTIIESSRERLRLRICG